MTDRHICHHLKILFQVYAEVALLSYDGNLLYWAKRLKQHPLVNNEKAKLLQIQKGQCPRWGLSFRDGDLLEVDHSIPLALGGKDALSNKWVYHRHCHDEKTAEALTTIAGYKALGINYN